jgi:hypothetical protein
MNQWKTYKIADELAVGLAGGSDDLRPRGVGATIGNVVCDGSREEHRFLGNHANLAAQRLGIHSTDILAIDQDTTRGRAIKSKQDRRNGGFATSRGANNSHISTLRDLKIEVFEDSHGRASRVAKAHILEPDWPASRLHLESLRRVDCRLSVLQFKESACSTDPFHQLRVKA